MPSGRKFLGPGAAEGQEVMGAVLEERPLRMTVCLPLSWEGVVGASVLWPRWQCLWGQGASPTLQTMRGRLREAAFGLALAPLGHGGPAEVTCLP